MTTATLESLFGKTEAVAENTGLSMACEAYLVAEREEEAAKAAYEAAKEKATSARGTILKFMDTNNFSSVKHVTCSDPLNPNSKKLTVNFVAVTKAHFKMPPESSVEKRAKLYRWLKNGRVGLKHLLKLTVNANSFGAAMRERIEAGKEVPKELVSIFEERALQVRRS